MSAEYQNDILHCLANILRKNTVDSLGTYWALMVDESKDISRKEQLSFVIRSTSPDGSVWEKPLGTYHVEKVTRNCYQQCSYGYQIIMR